MDNALLLQAIAGVDGLDDRQGAGTPFRGQVPDYPRILEETKEQGVKGMKIGILQEGFTANSSPDVESRFREAVSVFETLGAEVAEVSVPFHAQAYTVYNVLSKMSNHMGMFGKAAGRRQVMMTDLLEKKGIPYTQEAYSKVRFPQIPSCLGC